MKVLFLDIDGVLNNESSKERFNCFTGIDQRLLKLFKDWWKPSEVNIVLSSTWRTDPEFVNHLIENGLTFIGHTPKIANVPRGHEIGIWLDNHLDVTKFAILDDCTDLQPLRKYLVQTSARWGLQTKHLNLVDKLLKDDTSS